MSLLEGRQNDTVTVPKNALIPELRVCTGYEDNSAITCFKRFCGEMRRKCRNNKTSTNPHSCIEAKGTVSRKITHIFQFFASPFNGGQPLKERICSLMVDPCCKKPVSLQRQTKNHESCFPL